MKGWVINPFLTEEHVRILHNENMLKDFSICSKPVIVTNIVSYINGDGDEEIKSLLNDCYKDKISFVDVQSNELITNSIDKIYGYTFDSVHAGLSIADLNKMKETIVSVYNEEFNVPYINVIPGDIIAGIINNLLAIFRVNKNQEYKKLAYLLTKNKELFKDKQNAKAKGTMFKEVSKRSLDLDVILRGIDFLIVQKEANRPPESWRVY